MGRASVRGAGKIGPSDRPPDLVQERACATQSGPEAIARGVHCNAGRVAAARGQRGMPSGPESGDVASAPYRFPLPSTVMTHSSVVDGLKTGIEITDGRPT